MTVTSSPVLDYLFPDSPLFSIHLLMQIKYPEKKHLPISSLDTYVWNFI